MTHTMSAAPEISQLTHAVASAAPAASSLSADRKLTDYFRLARHPSTMAASMVCRLPTRNFTPLPLALSLETLLR